MCSCVYIFEVKLTFEMLTVREQQHIFSTHERMFIWKCQSFWNRKFSTWGGLEPPIFGFMPNALTNWAIRARHSLFHVFFLYWLWRYRYFWRKVDIWNANCTRATAFIFDIQTDVLMKVSTFLDSKCLDRRGTRTPNLRIHAECLVIHNYTTTLKRW